MGREIKRVPLDFNWPLNKVWGGFINPFYKKCPDYDSGYTKARTRFSDLVRLIMLSGSDSLEGRNHPYFKNMLGLYHDVVPSPDMATLTEGLAGRKPSSFGHDACDSWSAEEKIILAAGLDPDVWGICQKCKGDAIDPLIKERYEAWKETPVPVGDGYQLWETVSEGSPISPVFKTPEELADYLTESPDYTWKENDRGTTKEQWLKFINGPGWAISGILKDGRFMTGVQAT